jgi:hypothetical protein
MLEDIAEPCPVSRSVPYSAPVKFRPYFIRSEGFNTKSPLTSSRGSFRAFLRY